MASAKIVRVSNADVAALLLPLKPGGSYESAWLYDSYVQAMRAAGRPVATRDMLGRALTQNGCRRRVVRRGKGPRGRQVRTDTPVYDLPSVREADAPFDEPSLASRVGASIADEITELVRAMGQGIFPSSQIYHRYLGMPRKRAPLTHTALMRRLTLMGYPHQWQGKRACRYLDPR
jgi:hypothetical protein